MTGHELKEYCETKRTVCVGYITGVADAILSDQRLQVNKQYICVRPGTQGTQLADVVIAFLMKIPKQGSLPASLLVNNALVKAYPCAKPR